MENNGHCRLCEKVSITVGLNKPVKTLSELPNTFSSVDGKYEWKFHDFMAYALIPRFVENTTARIEMYACIDEDDLDDIDLTGYTERFFRETILPQWNNILHVHVFEPLLSPPEDVECRKAKIFREASGR